MNSASRRGRRSAIRYGRWLTWLIGGLLIIVFASYVALPIGLSWYLPELAQRYGIQLAVQKVRVAPFESRLRLLGVRIGTPGGTTTEWSSLETRVDLEALFAGRVVLGEIRMSEARVHAAESSQGAGGADMPARSAAFADELDVGVFTIESVELAKLSDLLGRPVAVERLRLDSLADLFRPEGTAVRAELSIGEGSARVDGRISYGASGWILDASVGAERVPVDGFSALFDVDRRWRGTLEGSGPVRVVHSPATDAFSATTGGRWRVNGLEAELSDALTVRAQIDGDGSAFIVLLGDVVDTLSVDAALSLRGLEMEVANAFEVEAPNVTLRIDASQALSARVSVEGTSPEVRVRAASGAFDAKADKVKAQLALLVANGTGIEVERLESSALAAGLHDGGSIAVSRLELEGMFFDSASNVLSAAAATARRMDWQDFDASQGSGTATGVTVRGIERSEEGALRFAQASAETVDGGDPGPALRMNDVVLESAEVSPSGKLTLGGLRASDSSLSNRESTLVLERVSLDGIGAGGGVVSVMAGRADVVDHTAAAGRAMVGKQAEIAGAVVSGESWGATHIRFGHLDLATGEASYAFRELALADTAGEGWAGNAREVRLGGIERWFGGNRVAGSDLSANSVMWDEDAASARDIGVVSVTLDLMGRYRWQARGGRLNGVDAGVSGDARADAVSLDALAMTVAEESIIGISSFESGGLTFDGKNRLHASNATAGRARIRVRADVSVDATGLRADALEWNGESLNARRGAAPLMSVRAAPVRASLDAVEFGPVRLGARGLLHLDALSAASFRGGVATESHLQWTAGESKLAGYRVRGSGETTLDVMETREVEVIVVGDDARLRADRFAVQGARLESSGDLTLADVLVDGATLGRPNDNRLSADAVRGGHVVLRDAGLAIGSLDLSGLETAIGMNEKGEWDLPLLPLGSGDAGVPYSVRIDEASIADPDAVVHLVDRTTDPNFSATVNIASATLRGFRSSATGSPAHFSIESTAEAFSSARVEGTLIPTLTGTDLDLNVEVQGLALPAFSPYVRLHLGQDLAAGQADATLALAVRSADLDGVVDFRPSGVEFRDVASPANRSVVGSALLSIEERNGAIELKAPFRGSVDDPGFDLDRLLVQALANSALAAAEGLEKIE